MCSSDLQIGETEAGISHLRTALSLSPQQPHFLYNLAKVLQESGLLKEAIGCYREAVAIRSDYAEAWNNLAGLLNQEGNYQEAHDSAVKAVHLAPSNTCA